jgi:hypothetical protein
MNGGNLVNVMQKIFSNKKTLINSFWDSKGNMDVRKGFRYFSNLLSKKDGSFRGATGADHSFFAGK